MTPTDIHRMHERGMLKELEAYFYIRFRGQQPTRQNYFDSFGDYIRITDNIDTQEGCKPIVWHENIGRYRKARSEKAETKRVKCLLIDAIISLQLKLAEDDREMRRIINTVEMQLLELN